MDRADRGAPPVRSLIGTAIRRRRSQDGLTLEQLAGRAGISYQHLCGIENGRHNFSIAMLERICYALDASPAALFTSAYTASD